MCGNTDDWREGFIMARQRPGKKRRPPRRRRLSDAIARICTHVCRYGRQGVALHTTPTTQEIASHDKPACEDPHWDSGLAQTRTRTSSSNCAKGYPPHLVILKSCMLHDES